MNIKTKINNKLQDSSNWILNSPESLVILMLMGTGIAFLFFGVLAVVFLNNRNWFLLVLFGVFSLLSLKQFIKVFRMVRKTSLKEALGGITANEFVWKKDKYGNKLYGGVEDGNGKDDSKRYGSSSNKKYKENAGGQRENNKQPERTDIRFSECIQLNDGNSKETTND